jgi:signal transduction histidine kinase
MKKRYVYAALLLIGMPLWLAETESFMDPQQYETEEPEIPAVDLEAKRKTTADLVTRGITFFEQHTLAEVGTAFTHTKDFIVGELYLFIFDINGRCLAHGQEENLLWQDMYDYKDAFGVSMVQEFIKKAQSGGGWVSYEWRGATKVSMVKMVTKDEKNYVIGCGYYPHSKEDLVQNLVRGAVALFNTTVQQGRDPKEALSILNYPMGKFIVGDLYLYALDFEGNIFAQGDRPGLTGGNSLDYADSNGVKANQVIIKKLKETNGGVWVEYTSKNAPKRAYAEKVVDKTGKEYFIACGYYPDAGRDNAVDLVRRAFQTLKKTGESASFKLFSSKRDEEFRYGDLYLEVYNTAGKCVANGGNEELVGRDMINEQDESGRFYIKEFIQRAENGGGWVNIKLKGAFKTVYVELVEMGLKKYVITAGLYPSSKSETMMLLARSAADAVRASGRKGPFADFVQKGGKYMRGDLSIFAFDLNGVCYAYADSYALIWRNLFNAQDDDGMFFVQKFIKEGQKGATTIRYKLNGCEKVAYIEMVDLKGKSLIIGSSYYL